MTPFSLPVSCLLFASLVMTGSGMPAAAESSGETCTNYNFRDADASAPRFIDFPARGQKIRPAWPKIGRDYRFFETAIRRGAATGPNFAGHFTFVAWGTGAGGFCWAILDARSGKIGNGGCAVTQGEEYQQPQYRLESRLLVLSGKLTGDREGVAYYEWNGSRLRELRFISKQELCLSPNRSARPQ